MKTLLFLSLFFTLLNADQGPIHFKDQVDDTDTFAIPLDTSEAEEAQEMKELQEESNEYKRR